MFRFSFFVACFVLALAMLAISVPEVKAHGGGNGASITVFSNGGFAVRSNGGHVSSRGFNGGGGGITINNFGPPRSNANRFNQNGGVNRFGPRR